MQVVDIELKDIWMDEEFNSRDKIQFTQIIDLAKSIRTDGLIQPILVTPKDNGECHYKVVAGHRRFKAHMILVNDDPAFSKIHCIIRENLTEVDARVLNLNENLARKDLNILEEAFAIKPLFDLGLAEQDIVNKLNSTRGWVQVRVLLLKLPKEIQEECAAGLVNQTQIRDLYSLLHNGAPNDVIYEEVRKAKESKLKGEAYNIKKRKNGRLTKPPAENKHARNRKECLVMIDHLLDNNNEGLATRCLAWASGEITDMDIFLDLKDQDQNYIIPREGLDYAKRV